MITYTDSKVTANQLAKLIIADRLNWFSIEEELESYEGLTAKERQDIITAFEKQEARVLTMLGSRKIWEKATGNC